MSSTGWYGVDLDGTLAVNIPGQSMWEIGEPIKPMVDRARQHIAAGDDIRIFTARVSDPNPIVNARQKLLIRDWCVRHLGVALPITNQKDYKCVCIYDDRARQVEVNTGRIIGEE